MYSQDSARLLEAGVGIEPLCAGRKPDKTIEQPKRWSLAHLLLVCGIQHREANQHSPACPNKIEPFSIPMVSVLVSSGS